TKLMVQLLENVHFNGKELQKDDLGQLIPNYMEDLDSQRLFFLASDAESMSARFTPGLSNDLHYKGNIEAAFRIYESYLERVTARVAWIEEQLKGEWDLTVDDTYQFDRSEESWPASATEADELWKKRLKFELLQDLLNDKPIETATENVSKRYKRILKNLDELDIEEIQEIYLTALTRLYDPHTGYMSPSQLEDFAMQMRLSLVGIGAQLTQEDEYSVIRELIPGGPAELSKALKPNDKIVAVAQGDGEPVDVRDMKLRKVVELIRGDKGTIVKLTILPADATDPSVRKEVVIVRDLVKLNASRASAAVHQVPTADGKFVSIGVITLPSFYGLDDTDEPGVEKVTATRDVEALIRKLEAENVSGIVLDLRENGGGLLSEAVDLTGLFIDRGPVVQVKSSNGRIEVRPDNDPKVDYDGPLAVLTSRYSASASEIVAGALQNYGRGIIVGSNNTHGKGTVQAVLEMNNFLPRWRVIQNPRMGAARMTVQKFYLPNGASTQNRGVVPDIVLPSIEEFLPVGESDLPNALAWDTIPPVYFDGAPLDTNLLNSLRERSSQRQMLTEEFAFLRKNIDWFKERQVQKAVSLSLEARKETKKSDDVMKDQLKKERTDLAQLNFSTKEILLDGVVKPTVPTPVPDANDADAEDPADEARFDIALRESLRVLVDAIELEEDPSLWRSDATALTASTLKETEPVP
ncbi:MAG TPA: carboxy terminal-processing peptidase, partial [Opitutaceae bacterium]|nr:carboxy terminal-processing peptidase [Opitutaceae bacterium]